jgi:RND family efflux transporter MFP subunit
VTRNVCLITSLLVCVACGGGDGARQSTPTPVRVAVTEDASPVAHARYPGVLEARRAVRVSFPQGGRIERVLVRENQVVAAGDTLAFLERGGLRAAVAAAAAAHEQALRTERRMSALHRTGGVSDSRMDDAGSALEVAEARLQQAQQALEDAVLTTPLSGKVVGTVPDEGVVVGPGTPVLEVVRTDSLNAVAWVGDGARRRVLDGGTATVGTSDGERVLQGVVTLVSSNADEQRGGYRVEVTVVDTSQVLQPGMAADVELPLAGARSAVSIPADAVVARGLGASVFVVDGGRVREVPVEVYELRGPNAVCHGPISAGDSVVVSGAEYLRDGATIEAAHHVSLREHTLKQ